MANMCEQVQGSAKAQWDVGSEMCLDMFYHIYFSSSTRLSLPTLHVFILDDDYMVLPQRLTCVSEFNEVLGRYESQHSQGYW